MLASLSSSAITASSQLFFPSRNKSWVPSFLHRPFSIHSAIFFFFSLSAFYSREGFFSLCRGLYWGGLVISLFSFCLISPFDDVSYFPPLPGLVNGLRPHGPSDVDYCTSPDNTCSVFTSFQVVVNVFLGFFFSRRSRPLVSFCFVPLTFLSLRAFPGFTGSLVIFFCSDVGCFLPAPVLSLLFQLSCAFFFFFLFREGCRLISITLDVDFIRVHAARLFFSLSLCLDFLPHWRRMRCLFLVGLSSFFFQFTSSSSLSSFFPSLFSRFFP